MFGDQRFRICGGLLQMGQGGGIADIAQGDKRRPGNISISVNGTGSAFFAMNEDYWTGAMPTS
jgi:hypothetical protein